MTFEQLGNEGRTVDDAPQLDANSGLVYFGNRLCPFAHRAWWALLEKQVTGIDYIHIELGPNKPAWYQEKINPFGTVPCLYDHGRPVFESMILAEYFEEKFPNQGTKLLPEDPVDRASVRLFCSQFGEKGIRPLYALLSNQDRSKDEELQQALVKVLKEFNTRLEKQSSGPFFLGDQVSLADLALIPFVDRMSTVLKHYRGFDFLALPELSRIRDAYEASKKREAFQKTSQAPEFYIFVYNRYANPAK